MGAKPSTRLELDKAWALDWPEASRPNRPLYYGGSLSAEVLVVLREKNYVPVDFRTLEGPERIEALFEATQNGTYDPSPAQTKLIDLHLKQINTKKPDEDKDSRSEVLDFLDLLASFASKERPDWAKTSGDVVKTPTSAASEPEIGANAVADLMKELF